MKSYLILIVSLSLLLSANKSLAKNEKKLSIYIVDSYRPDKFPWTAQINKGIIGGLRKAGYVDQRDYVLNRSTMDAYVNFTLELMQKQAKVILEDIKRVKPDIIFTTDDDALRFVGLRIKDTPVIFNGINGDPSKYIKSPKINSILTPGHNITGVYQTTYFTQSLQLIKKIMPSVKNFAVITDTTTTGKALLASIKNLPKDALPLEWKKTFISDNFSEWKTEFKKWEGEIDAYFLLSANALRDGNKRLMTNDEVVGWIKNNSKIPGTASWAFQVAAGVMVSATDDGITQGEYSVSYATRILKGEKPGDLPIITPPNGIPAINLKILEKLSIRPKAETMEIFIDNGIIFK